MLMFISINRELTNLSNEVAYDPILVSKNHSLLNHTYMGNVTSMICKKQLFKNENPVLSEFFSPLSRRITFSLHCLKILCLR